MDTFAVLFVFCSAFWVYIVLWIVLKPKPLVSTFANAFTAIPTIVFLGVCGGMAAYFRIDSWFPVYCFCFPLMFNLIGMMSSSVYHFFNGWISLEL